MTTTTANHGSLPSSPDKPYKSHFNSWTDSLSRTELIPPRFETYVLYIHTTLTNIHTKTHTHIESNTPTHSLQVSQHLSAMVNIQDNNGILEGNWSDNYSGGASPLSWTGSAEILNQFMKTRKPVKFAQCWVFSGVLTSRTASLSMYIYISLTPTDRYTHTVFDYNCTYCSHLQ